MFSFFKNLTGGKLITAEMLEPALEKMKEHLITKNVAAEISEKLCSSVMSKLEGKVIGTFSGEQISQLSVSSSCDCFICYGDKLLSTVTSLLHHVILTYLYIQVSSPLLEGAWRSLWCRYSVLSVALMCCVM